MSQQVWVINASPLILLGKLGHINLLEGLANQVRVPDAVYAEVAAGRDDAGADASLIWAQTRRVRDLVVPASILGWDLGAGESQVLHIVWPVAIWLCWTMVKRGQLPKFIRCRWSVRWV